MWHFTQEKKSNKRTVAVCLNIDFDQSGILILIFLQPTPTTVQSERFNQTVKM